MSRIGACLLALCAACESSASSDGIPPISAGAHDSAIAVGPDGKEGQPSANDIDAASSVPAPWSGVALSVGPFASCLIDDRALVHCFGRCGPSGQGGMRSSAPAGLKASAVAVGRSFACALLTEPEGGSVVRCWGGDPATAAPRTLDAVEIVASGAHACMRNASGAVTCWGATLGDGGSAPAPPDNLVAKQLAASGAMDCAIASDDAVRCWGAHAAAPPSDWKVKYIALSSQLADPIGGPRFGCAIMLTDDVRCWGDDPGGVQSVPSGLKARAVGAAGAFACAVDLGGKLVCWGNLPRFGQPVPDGVTAKQLSMTFRTAGAVLGDGSFTFWGDTSDQRGAPPSGAHAP